MLPTSIAGSIRISCAVDAVARLDPPHVAALEGEVAAGLARRAGGGRAGWRRRRRRRRPRRRRAGRRPRAPTGPMKPAGPMRSADLVRMGGAEGRAAARSASLISLTRWSPRTSTSTSPRSSTHHRVGLQQRAGRHAQGPGDLLDRRQARRGTSSGASSGARQLHRLRLGAGHLDVGGVARRRARPRSPPTRTAPCTRGRRCRPSSRRRTRRGTTRGRRDRRCGRRPRCAWRSRRPGPRGRGRRCRSPS